MATGSIVLNPQAAVFPDMTSGNLAPALQRVKSGAAVPKPYFYQLAFDAAQTEQVMWQFVMPPNYASDPVLTVLFKHSVVNTGNVRWDARLGAVTPGDATNVNDKALAAANLVTTAVPATLGHLGQAVIALANNDALAAGDLVFLYLGRLGADAADTYANDVHVISAALTYTAT